MKAYRGTLTEPGKESPYRNRTIEENLNLFADMKGREVMRKVTRYFEPKSICLPQTSTCATRSFIGLPMRFIITPVTSGAFIPCMTLPIPLRMPSKASPIPSAPWRFEDHRPLYDWCLREVGWWSAPPQQIEFARLNLTHTVMSKRLLKGLVDDGVVEGWDDPRMPTIAGLRRRGYTPEAIRDFCERIGVAKSNSTVDVGLLEHCVREDLANRVESRNVVEHPIKVIITNYPEGILEEMEMENSRNLPELGTRRVPFGREILIDGDDFMEEPSKGYFRLFPGNEVRLKGAYFITCTNAIKDAQGNVIELHCTYDPQTKSGDGFEGRKVKGTIHWVEATTALPIIVRHYEYLMTDDESGESRINPHSVKELNAYAEPSLTAANPGDRFQFFRHGYYIADSRLTQGDHRVFNRIVDLKSSFKVTK